MNIMIENIFFYIISIALFVIMFIKLMKKNDNLYLSSLILQSIGIAINFIGLIFRIELNLFFRIITYILSVIIPFFILICEYNHINILEKAYLILADLYFKSHNTKDAKKILLALIDKNDNNKDAHKMLAEIYEKEGLTDELCLDALRDLLYKNRECLKVYGVPGTYTQWFQKFFTLERFTFGRLEYDVKVWEMEERHTP